MRSTAPAGTVIFAAVALVVAGALVVPAVTPALAAGNTTSAPNTTTESPSTTATATATPTETATETVTDTEAVEADTETDTGTGTEEEPSQIDTDTDSSSGSDTDIDPSSVKASSNPTEYGIDELAERGVRHEGAPQSMRFMGSYGSATVRHEPQGPLSSDWEYLDPDDDEVNADEVTLRTVRLAPGTQIDEDVQVHVVAWQRGEREVERGNETTTLSVAENVTHRRYNVTLGRGYDNATIDLPKHYGSAQQITMWVDEYPDARWVFEHRSVPSTKGVSVDSRGDMWWWAAQNILLVAVPGILISAVGGRKMIDAASGAGPMKGAMWWGFVGAIAILIGAIFAWFQTAILLAYIPQLLGIAITLVAFVAVLEVAGRPHSWVLFENHELEDAKNPLGENVKDAVYETVREHRVVRHDDGTLRLVKPGIRPFLARFFAEPAFVPDEYLRTEVELKGSKWDKKYLADPREEEPLYWKPAHWTIRNPFVDVDESLSLLERLHIGRLVVGVGAFAVMAYVGAQTSLPAIGAAVGLVPTVVMAVRAEDGFANFQPAPVHMRRSEASLTTHREEYQDALSLREADRARWEAEARNINEIREQAARRDATVSKQLNEGAAGLDIDEEMPGPNENGTSPDEEQGTDRDSLPDLDDVLGVERNDD